MKQPSSFYQKENSTVKTGGIANPAEVKRAILEATKDAKRADRDFDKLIADKEEILADLAELRMHEKQAEEKTLPASVKKVIERSVRSLQKRLSILNGVLPEVNLSADQKKIQTIIAEWKEGKRNFRNAYGAHLRAERKLAENPADHRAMGDANRTEAEMYADAQKMDTLAKEAELIVSHTIPDPVKDEAVNIHTGEELKVPAISEEIKEQPKEQSQEPAILTEQESQPQPEPQTQPEPEHSLAEQLKPEESLLAEKSEEQPSFTNLLPPSVELPAPPAHELIEDHTHHAPHEESRTYEEHEEVGEHEEVPIVSDVADQAEEISESEEVITAEEIKDTESLIGSPEEESSTKIEIPEVVQVQPEEEKSPALMHAEKTLHEHLDRLWGTKGFLGFGNVRGKDSPHWNDAAHGFEKKTIAEVYDASPEPSPDLVGIENADEVGKMRAYIEKAQEETGVPPFSYETVQDYIIRTLSTVYERTVNQK